MNVIHLTEENSMGIQSQHRPIIGLTAVLALIALSVAGCEDQRPIALAPKPDPGVKAGETLPAEPDNGPHRHRDGNVPLPAATTPSTPGEPNSPGAPVPLTSPRTSASAPVPGP